VTCEVRASGDSRSWLLDGLISLTPSLSAHRVDWLAADLAVSLSFLALGGWLFARGLRRYESGSLWTAGI
jgi:hypothetical protein